MVSGEINKIDKKTTQSRGLKTNLFFGLLRFFIFSILTW